MAEPIHTKINTLQQCVTDNIIALNARISPCQGYPMSRAQTLPLQICHQCKRQTIYFSGDCYQQTMSLVEDLNSSLGHVTKTLILQLNKKVLELASSVDARFKALPSPSNLAAL
jgi:hypothetical protein